MLLLSLLMAGCKEEEKVVELTPVSVSSVETEAATTQKSTKSPTEPTTATEEEVKISPRVQRKLKKMDIHEKVCQMFMAVPEKTTYYYDTLTYVDDWYKKCYEEYPIGGYIYFDANIVWEQQLCDLLSDSQEWQRSTIMV